MTTNVGRNDPCPCGSGKKYKKCCMGKPAAGLKGRIQQKTTSDVPVQLNPGERGQSLLSRVKKISNDIPFWEREDLTVKMEEADYRQANDKESIYLTEDQARADDYPHPTLRKEADPNALLPQDRFSDNADPTVQLDEVDYRPPA